jgi:protein O-GlcNAc transferase
MSDSLHDQLAEAYSRYQAGDLRRAASGCERVLSQEPENLPALQILSLVRFAQKRVGEALELARRAIAAAPEDPDGYNNLGLILARIGKPDVALAQYDKAVELAPAHAAVLINRGNALWDLNRLEEAVVSYDRAIAVQPDNVEALYNRANAALALRHIHEALKDYGRVLAASPDFPGALYNRGVASAEVKQYDDALADFRRLLAVAPDYAYACGTALRVAREACDWGADLPTIEGIERDVRGGARSAAPFAFLGLSASSECQLACARTWIQHRYPAAPAGLWQGEIYRHDKIRIAYLSADFREHAMPYLMAGLLERHNSKRFEITGISFVRDDGSVIRRRIAAAFDRFIDVGTQSDQEVARVLREMEIDIAVDLMGLTTGCRPGILAMRPAPIQVSYIGYPGTIAADHIDYLIADRTVIPPGDEAFYTEKVVYLPDTYQANDDRRQPVPKPPARAEAGLPDSAFVFASFNNAYKISPELFGVWMRLLRDVQGSVLWLVADNDTAMRRLRAEAAARGIAPERILFAPKIPLPQHLARLALADLILDTLPYNGHTTTSDALWCGRPVLTCRGTTFAGRVSASLLQAAGVPELIAESLEEYEARARALATDRAALNRITSTLVRNRATHPLFNTDRFRRHIEQAYVTMWERYQRGEKPESFAVTPIA